VTISRSCGLAFGGSFVSLPTPRKAQALVRLGFFLLLIVGGVSRVSSQERSARPRLDSRDTIKQEDPPFRGLDASLYMLTSAEYKACCLQAFRWAGIMAKEKLNTRQDQSKPAAVVMDLDETILDNGWFQSNQIRESAAFDPQRWERWERTGADKVRLIPGAKKFIDQLRELKIEPIYITNRNDKAREQTKSVLERFEIAVPDEQLLCADEQTGSDKTSRREIIAAKFDILVFVGDNLRDFDERFKYDRAVVGDKRGKTVEELQDKFGVEWIILPNPSYGEWNKRFSNSKADVELLYK
jgi:5'-nucleotidase (lipoprotein e(P4) family)